MGACHEPGLGWAALSHLSSIDSALGAWGQGSYITKISNCQQVFPLTPIKCSLGCFNLGNFETSAALASSGSI